MSQLNKIPQIRFKQFTNEWQKRNYENIFNYERPDKYIVKSDKYSNISKTPVLTANKAFILGYTDEVATYKREKESIIFDDFTLDSKFVNFPYMVKSSAIKILTLKNKDIDNLKFNYELLNNTKFNILGHARHYISVVQPTQTYTTIKKEQEKIAEFINNIDRNIANNEQKQEKLINIKKTLLEKMFPSNCNNIPQIRFKTFTKAWQQQNFKQMAKYRNGKAHENDISEDGKYVVINSKFCSTNGKIRKFSNKQLAPLYKNDIAFVLSDVPNGKALARTYLVEKDEKYTLNQRIAAISPLEKIDAYYLYILMNRNQYFLQFDDGAKQTNLSLDDINNFNSMMPSYEEQKEIGEFFRKIDKLINLYQSKNEKLKNIKKSLINKMFV